MGSKEQGHVVVQAPAGSLPGHLPWFSLGLPFNLSPNSNHHITDGTHDVRRLVSWISTSVSEMQLHSTKSADLDLGEQDSEAAQSQFEQQAKLMRKAMHIKTRAHAKPVKQAGVKQGKSGR